MAVGIVVTALWTFDPYPYECRLYPPLYSQNEAEKSKPVDCREFVANMERSF